MENYDALEVAEKMLEAVKDIVVKAAPEDDKPKAALRAAIWAVNQAKLDAERYEEEVRR